MNNSPTALPSLLPQERKTEICEAGCNALNTAFVSKFEWICKKQRESAGFWAQIKFFDSCSWMEPANLPSSYAHVPVFHVVLSDDLAQRLGCI